MPVCRKRAEPKNGALACSEKITLSCMPYCHEGYDFSYKPEGLYFCYNGKWHYWTNTFDEVLTLKDKWPDCAGECFETISQIEDQIKFPCEIMNKGLTCICKQK